MDINIPMENAPLTVMPIPAVYQGRRLRFYCDNPLQRDVYLLTDRKLTGPYISGEKGNTNLGFFEQFFTHESLLLCVNKSQMGMDVPVSMNPLMVVLPTGQSIMMNLDCKVSIGFHVEDSAALLDDYCNCRFTNVEALIRGTIRHYVQTTLTNVIPALALSNPLPLVLSNLQKLAVSLAADAKKYLNRTLHWLHISFLDLSLVCTNTNEITNALKPMFNLPPEMIPLVQAVLSNPALTVDQALQLVDRLCPTPYKYDVAQLQQAASNVRYLA